MPTAVLNPQFFQDHAPNVQFFQKWKNASNWGPQNLPIYEWQGILYIATVIESPDELSIPHVYVQAESSDLEQLWQQLQGGNAEAPEGILEDFDHNTPAPQAHDDVLELAVGEDFAAPLIASAAVPYAASATPAATSTNASDINDVFKSMNSANFKQVMVLLVQGEIAKPWKWSETLKNPQQKIRIELSQLSPFRVVYRTHHSFFGAFKTNPVMETIVKTHFDGKAFDHVTIVPVMSGDKLIALLMGTLEKDVLSDLSSTHLSLEVAEKSAEMAAQLFANNPSLLQAA
jgi:hypothetical protein